MVKENPAVIDLHTGSQRKSFVVASDATLKAKPSTIKVLSEV